MTSVETTIQHVNKETVRAMYAAFAANDSDAMDALLTHDFVGHGIGPGLSDDAEGLKQSCVAMHAALSDCTNEIDDIVAETDKVVVRFTTRATHIGELFGMPPSGRPVAMTGMEWYRLSDGKIAEFWGEYNMAELFSPAKND